MNQWHYNKIKQLKDWERDLSAVLTFKSNEMDEETRKDTIRYRDLLVYANEQIERVRELEDKLARIRFINNDYDKQNKRYKQALKFYANKINYLTFIENGKSNIEHDQGGKARKALDGEER